MMKLSTMWKVDSMIDVAGSSPLAERILDHWTHDHGSVRFFRSSTNFLYVFRDDGNRYFLRFADGSERSREAIDAEVDLVNWLAGAGIDVARPVRSANGNFVETIETELGTFHAVVFAALAGAQFDISELNDAQFRAWGEALGKLHTALKDYAGPGFSARRTWRDHLELAREYILGDAPALQDECDQIAALLGTLPVDHDTYGLIHFDFELDNLVWQDQGIGILDFDDCAHYWYAVDIAFALQDLFNDGADLHDTSFRQFVRGYTTYCPLNEVLLSQIPLFLRLGNLVGYARLVRAMDLPHARAYPEWLEALKRKLQNRMEAYRMSQVHGRM